MAVFVHYYADLCDYFYKIIDYRLQVSITFLYIHSRSRFGWLHSRWHFSLLMYWRINIDWYNGVLQILRHPVDYNTVRVSFSPASAAQSAYTHNHLHTTVVTRLDRRMPSNSLQNVSFFSSSGGWYFRTISCSRVALACPSADALMVGKKMWLLQSTIHPAQSSVRKTRSTAPGAMRMTHYFCAVRRTDHLGSQTARVAGLFAETIDSTTSARSIPAVPLSLGRRRSTTLDVRRAAVYLISWRHSMASWPSPCFDGLVAADMWIVWVRFRSIDIIFILQL